MIPIPAIDLKDGNVVRLLQGNFKEEKVYSAKPEQIARLFQDHKASRLHVVDLDGALKGEPKNMLSVETILRHVEIPVEIGGGIRTLTLAKKYFDMGISWVILGTKACLDKGFLQEALKEFKEKIIVGIDASNGYVATDGWTKITSIKSVDMAKEVETLGGRCVIYTDISKDGVLKGPNLNEIQSLSDSLNIDVIASGGVGALEDISALICLKKKNIIGVIIGKALYENKFSLEEAVRLCREKSGEMRPC